MSVLLLGSQSHSRQQLLMQAGIVFIQVPSSADETACNRNRPIEPLLKDIAQLKMEHIVLLPGDHPEQRCFVLTADTMSMDVNGVVHGKPKDKQEAIDFLKLWRQGACTGSAFCLDRRIWVDGGWAIEERIIGYAQAQYTFDVPDDEVERYFEQSECLDGLKYTQLAGAIAVERFGAQYLGPIQGSYTAIVGLPMFEVRQALEEIGFKGS